MRVADYIMERIAKEGVSHVFQVTGRGALFLSDALAKSSELESISLHHEQSCSFAATAYADQRNGLGACLVSTGCASTNAITGVLSAWQDGLPVIFVSGQNILKETSRHTGLKLRTFGQQEADIVSIIEPITKYCKMITSPEEVPKVMDEAISCALSDRRGPVWIDVPLDLQSAKLELGDTSKALRETHLLRFKPSPEDVSKVISRLRNSKRPIILVGKGVAAAGAVEELRDFAERSNIPVSFTPSGSDIYGSVNRLSIGSVGSMGCSRAGNFAVANSDFVLVLGSRLNSLTTGLDFCKFAREAEICVVDIDPEEHSKETIDIDIFVKSDVSCFLQEMLSLDHQFKVDQDWVNKCVHWKKTFGDVEPDFNSAEEVDLYQLAESLSEVLQGPSTLVTDSGLIEVILPSNIRFASGVRCVHPASQGAMGFALPAAIGAQYASGGSVIAVIGDGSIMMNLQELQSIRYQCLPIKIVVINNNVYSIIRRRQKDLFRRRTIGTDPENGVSCPEFKDVAKCFGLPYIRIEGVKELSAGLTQLMDCEGPVICEIMGRADQGYIEVGQTKSSVEKKFVRRPLEDQQPFLPRDKFTSEMLIDPIDQ